MLRAFGQFGSLGVFFSFTPNRPNEPNPAGAQFFFVSRKGFFFEEFTRRAKGAKTRLNNALTSIARLVLPHHSVDNVRDNVVRQAARGNAARRLRRA